MKILDIDLDFFQDIRITDMFGQFDSKEDVKAWEESAIEEFIQTRLNIKGKIPGRIFDKHSDAYFFWNDLIKSEKLSYPFRVDHIDAHSDLGYGNSFWSQLLNKIMYLPIEHRILPISELNEGNYLLFALANQWISELKYIHHPHCNNDILECLYKDFNSSNNTIQLVACDNLDGNDFLSGLQNSTYKIAQRDPEVPFYIIPTNDYTNNEPVDFINISLSHDYTTEETIKRCLNIFENYIINV